MIKLNTRTEKLMANALIALLIVAGVSMIACEAYGVLLTPLFVYGVTALISGTIFCLSYSRASGWVTLLALLAAALVAVIAGWRPVDRLNGILGNAHSGGNLKPYDSDIAILAMILLYTAVYTIVNQSNAMYPMLLLVFGSLAVLWFTESASASIHIFPVLLGLSALFSRREDGRAKLTALISLSLISALLACAIVPDAGVKNALLEEASHKALFRIMRLFNIEKDSLDERRSFTIASDGWLARKDYIGGPAYPREDEILRVQTSDTIYLRGAIRYIYNNRAWIDEDNESKAGKIKRYMLGGIEGLVYRDEYDRAFDLDKKSLDRYFKTETVTVDVLADNAFWSIYSPNRTESVALEGEVNAYYNNVGELFAGRPLVAGDRYELEVNVLNIPESALASAIASVQGEKDAAYASVLLLNRDLPSGIEPELYALTYEIIDGLGTPYEKACALCNWLSENGTYTLKGEYPPEDADFASWFVLNSRKGYCAYYACALTVMARIAGLPARYVEGYLVEPDENGERVVAGRNAHAWTEVYFENFGWLTFDATPSNLPGDGNRVSRQSSDHSGENDPGEGESAPAPTPTPTPTLPPRITPAPTREPDFGGDDPEPTTEPQTDNVTAPSQPDFGDEAEDDREDSSDGGFSCWWVFLILLAILALTAWRIRARIQHTDPANMAKGEKNAENRLMIWYRAMLTALSASGLAYENGHTPVSFAQQACLSGLCAEDFVDFSRRVARCRYGQTEADDETYRLAERAYADIKRRMRKTAKIRWIVKRVISGIGRLDPVP